SFIKEINRPGVNIVTVEDPVEYTLHGINQTQVNAKAKLTFATVLRSILRQDPNIIMIGEIRDEETAQIATRAAITGHLVFSTLHTNDAPGTVSRLVDMGIKPYLLADSLVGAIAQRLVKRLCPACKKASRTTKEETEFLGLDSPKRIFRPQGCNYCGQSGYRGRIGVHEVMENTAELREVISRRSDSEAIYEAAKQGGMRTLLENGIQYLLDGITSIDEIKTLDSGIQITE
ncbi:MAG: ATPase, T2SS/T4P/T4SS family, partial [Clostridia bacterium]